MSSVPVRRVIRYRKDLGRGMRNMRDERAMLDFIYRKML